MGAHKGGPGYGRDLVASLRRMVWVHLLSATNCLESWLPTVPGLLPRIGEHWEWHKGIGWGGGGEASPSICSAPGHQRHQCQCIPLGVGCSQVAVSSQDPAH